MVLGLTWGAASASGTTARAPAHPASTGVGRSHTEALTVKVAPSLCRVLRRAADATQRSHAWHAGRRPPHTTADLCHCEFVRRIRSASMSSRTNSSVGPPWTEPGWVRLSRGSSSQGWRTGASLAPLPPGQRIASSRCPWVSWVPPSRGSTGFQVVDARHAFAVVDRTPLRRHDITPRRSRAALAAGLARRQRSQ